jgi:S1-C subfamily serine protease
VIIFTYDDKGEFLQLGSGFFISQNGDVITNYHVLQGASSAEIKTSDGKTYPITYIVAVDESNDLIRLSVNIPSQDVYPLSLSKTIPEVGERIIVYGSPLGLENTVSDGIVSAIRDIPDFGRIIQITAPISPGSSGSPVLNMQGEVIGIATLQMVEGQNLNFAIPSEKIANLNLKEEKKHLPPKNYLSRRVKQKKIQIFIPKLIKKRYILLIRKSMMKHCFI